MRGLSVRSLPLLVAVVCSLVALQPAVAQDDSPNPEECTHEQPMIEDLQELYGTPHPEGAGEATSIVQATPEGFEMPAGEPADEATTAEIVTAIRVLTACHNAGDYLAGFSGLTDEFIVVQVGNALFDEDFVAAMEASPVALAEEQQTVILDIEEVIVLEDGRVAALFHYHSPTPQAEGIDGVETDLFIFENVDGAWLLDEVVENLEATHGPDNLATPDA